MRKIDPRLLIAAVCASVVLLSGCHQAASVQLSPQQVQAFGKPGMPPPAGYYAAMKAMQQQQQGTPQGAAKPPTGQ